MKHIPEVIIIDTETKMQNWMTWRDYERQKELDKLSDYDRNLLFIACEKAYEVGREMYNRILDKQMQKLSGTQLYGHRTQSHVLYRQTA
jgi:hypothetical protein